MTPSIAQTVPAALRAELARRQISGSGFAERLKVSEMWVYRRLTGRVEITLSDLERMAAQLDMSPMELLASATESAPQSAGPDRSNGQGPTRLRTPNLGRKGNVS